MHDPQWSRLAVSWQPRYEGVVELVHLQEVFGGEARVGVKDGGCNQFKAFLMKNILTHIGLLQQVPNDTPVVRLGQY